MKDYKDISFSNEDELYDYKELVGDSSWERMEYLTAWFKAKSRKELEEIVELYNWGE